MTSIVKKATEAMEAELNLSKDKEEHLANLDLFILDSSIRESTVGQLRGHTIEDKKAIYGLCKKCLMHSIVVASFSHMRRVDDDFCQWLKETGEDFSKPFSFSEVFGGKIVDGVPDSEAIPISLLKNQKYGLYNTIFEVDLADPNIAWDTKWTVQNMCELIRKWMFQVYDNINPRARIVLNFRDFPAALTNYPERALSVVEFLAKMPEDKRMFALASSGSNGRKFAK